MDSARDVDDILALLEGTVDRPNPDGEAVTLLEHSLQCANLLAIAFPEDVELQVAGLTHDVGHVLTPDEPEDHARAGSQFVAAVLGRRVAGLVDLHVTAKRYLVTVDPHYRDRLSTVSRDTLTLQGDTLSATATAAFLAGPVWREALALRRADDMAKTAGLRIGPVHQWRSTLDEVAQRFGIMRG